MRNEPDSGREGLGQIMFLPAFYLTRVLISSTKQNVIDLSLPKTWQYIPLLPQKYPQMALKNTILTAYYIDLTVHPFQFGIAEMQKKK